MDNTYIENNASTSKGEGRSLLVKAATLLFCERGYTATTIEDIAHRADLPPSALQSVGEDKSKLLLEVVGEVFCRLQTAAEQLTEQCDTPLLYGAMVSLLLRLVCCSVALRDVVVAAYSIPLTAQLLCTATEDALRPIMTPYLEQAGIERELHSIVERNGDRMITCALRSEDVTDKIRDYLNTTLPLYGIPGDVQSGVVTFAIGSGPQRAAIELLDKIKQNAAVGLAR